MDDRTQRNVRRVAELVAKADAILITAGAGMGVDSGLPDFRGDQVNLVTGGDRLELRNLAGRSVGRLAKKFDVKDGCRVVEARVSAITVRQKDANSGYAQMARTDRWEVVVPELIYEPK
jgi:hypothetical protein